MSEELDELASAYVDGEAAPDEVARVESSPELLDLVDEFRSVRASSIELPVPDEGTKERHLAIAMAAFDEQRDPRPSDLGLAAASSSSFGGNEEEATEDDTASSTDRADTTVVPMRSRSSRRMPPAWILNAAAAVVIVGGVGFALTQLPSGSDDTAADSVEVSEAEGDAESLDAASSSNAASTTAALERAEALADTNRDGDAAAGSDDAADEEVTEDDAGDSEEMEDDADAMEEAAADDSSESQAAPFGPLLSVPAGTTASEILAEFGLLFDDDVLVAPPHPCQDTIDAMVNPATGTMLGSTSVEIGGDVADLIVFDVAGQRGALLLNSDCGILSSE